jgi:two-component system chemotaxis response regulator CheY
MQILIVDDDHKNRKLLKTMVADLGECTTVENGPDAISTFEKGWQDWRPFDVILLDIVMPEMDGKQVLLKIRDIESEKKIAQRHRVKIIMVTALSDKDTVMTCLQEGCDDYILKPLDKHTIISKIKCLVNNRSET